MLAFSGGKAEDRLIHFFFKKKELTGGMSNERDVTKHDSSYKRERERERERARAE